MIFFLVDPSSDPQVRGDKYKTLFVARLSYEAKESDLEREFGRFGPIERVCILSSFALGLLILTVLVLQIRIVTDTHPDSKKGKKKPHRGYAFIVYEREKDLKAAYKETNGIRIKDRRVLVDVERGRTVPDWRPRRFGGGKGGRGYTKAAPPRPAAPGGFGPPAGPGGGLRGGFRGGFGGDRGGGFRGGRGGFGQPRGGIGYQGGGGFGGRGGYGGSPNGFSSSAPPPNAPSGPGGSGRFGSDRGGGGGFGSGGYGSDAPNGSGINGGGYGDSRGGRSYDDRNSSFRGSRGFGDRGGDPRGASGSNREPVRPREDRGYGDRDRDRERGGYGGRYRDEDSGRKRHHDEDGYDDHRSKRRY